MPRSPKSHSRSLSRSRSHSRSRSRSRSRSQSTSLSRSRSRSRSRKHRYSSRSRSRSRSHSPAYNREKKYPKGYQNSREFRGYHRGFRRPYNFRGRGRGFFPRGRFQRGGGYNNNNFRSNWRNYKQHPQKQYHNYPHQQQQQQHQQQQQQQQQQQLQNPSQGQSYNLQKRSGSPPLSHSRNSDRSSSSLSRQSQHSSSSSHSSSPKFRPALALPNQSSKDVNEELLASKDAQKEGGGGGDGEQVDLVQAGDSGEVKSSGKTEGKWQCLRECSSPRRASPLASSAVVGQNDSQTTSLSNSSPKITNNISNGTPSWQMGCNSSTTKKPTKDPVLSSFDFLSSGDYLDGDKTAISIAFKKFLEEQNKKAKLAKDNAKNTEANAVDTKEASVNGKASKGISVSKGYKKDIDGEVSLNSLFLSGDGEEDDELTVKPHLKAFHNDRHNGEESSKTKIKVTHSAQELFDACFGKWQNVVTNSDLDTMTEEMNPSRRPDKASAIAKQKLVGDFEKLANERGYKAGKMSKCPSSPSPTAPPRRNSDIEMYMFRGEDSPFTSSRQQDAKFNVRMDFLGESSISSSDVLAEERQLSQDLVQSSKKDQGFRSIFQHVKTAPLHQTPSELFAHHIVTIVHHIKAQHFASSGMTLNERFTMYQRRSAEKEMMKQRKSPEIHRRIDVSPSAFKKHAHLFEAMKSSEDGTYKDGGEKMKGDPMDLRLDIERRKKYPIQDRDCSQERGRDMRDSPDSSRERPVEKVSRSHKKSKKSKHKRSRSSSSSSSSSSKSQKIEDLLDDKSDVKDEGFDRARLGQIEPLGPAERGRPRGGFQVRVRGRGWNRGNNQGTNSHYNPVNMAVDSKNEDWDPEYTPKSRKYYLHDDRDGEGKWMDDRGRGRGSFLRGRPRFIIRKATTGPNIKCAKWAHDKFQDNGEQDDVQEEEVMEQDHKEGELNG